MQFTGEYRIPAPRQDVWRALNDPDILRVCIDGCERLEWVGDGTLDTTVRAKVGPVHARFNGTLDLTEVVDGQSYVLVGQGKGGAAGFAKGQAAVRLSDAEGGGTLLHYEVTANIGGKIATVGSRLISGVANKMADEFFQSFTNRLLVALKAAELDQLDTAEVAVGRHDELDLGTQDETDEDREAMAILRAMQTAAAADTTHAPSRPPALADAPLVRDAERERGRYLPITPGLVLIVGGWGFLMVVFLLLVL